MKFFNHRVSVSQKLQTTKMLISRKPCHACGSSGCLTFDLHRQKYLWRKVSEVFGLGATIWPSGEIYHMTSVLISQCRDYS